MPKLILIIVITLFVTFIGQRLYLSITNHLYSLRNDYVNSKDLTKANTDYLNLIKKQEQKQKNSMQEKPEERTEPLAIGSYKILFVLVKPLYLDDAYITPLIRSIENSATDIFYDCPTSNFCYNNLSLNYIPFFYKEQAKKYNVTDFDIKVEVTPIYTLESLTKVGDMAKFWGKDPFGVSKLQDSFNSILTKHHINIDKKTLVVFLFFDNSFTETEEDTSFYEHKTFRSFAQPDTGQAYINVYSFDPSFSKSLTQIATHEILHLFGATDKYEEKITEDRICSERGRGDLDQKPILPQTSADIMCGYIEVNADTFKKATLLDQTLNINKLTAKEIGW